nr:VP5 protein [Hubei lepidoptera virus 3]
MLTFEVSFKDVKNDKIKKINIYTVQNQKEYDRFHEELTKRNNELSKNTKLSITPRVINEGVTADSIRQKNKIETEVLYISMRSPKIDPDTVVCANEIGLPIFSRKGVDESMFVKDKRYKFVSKVEIEGNFFDELTMAISRKMGTREERQEVIKSKMIRNDLKSASWIVENNIKIFIRTGSNVKLDDLQVKATDVGNIREWRAVNDRWEDSDEGLTFTYSIFSRDFRDLIQLRDIPKAIKDIREHLSDEHHGAKGRKVFIIYDGKDRNEMPVKRFINELSYEIGGQIVEYIVDEANDVSYSLMQMCQMGESEIEDETNSDNIIFRGRREELGKIIIEELRSNYRQAKESGREDIDMITRFIQKESSQRGDEIVQVEKIPLIEKKLKIEENTNRMRADVVVEIGNCNETKTGAIVMSLERELGSGMYKGNDSWKSRMQKTFPETVSFYALSERVSTNDGMRIDKARRNNREGMGGIMRREDNEEREIIGIEANYIDSRGDEINQRNVELEIRKIVSAFKSAKNKIISTEMIGCHEYNGTEFIKSLEQMIAASIAEKSLVLYVENEEERKKMEKVINEIKSKRMEIREVYQLLITKKEMEARNFLEQSGDIVSEVAEEEKTSFTEKCEDKVKIDEMGKSGEIVDGSVEDKNIKEEEFTMRNENEGKSISEIENETTTDVSKNNNKSEVELCEVGEVMFSKMCEQHFKELANARTKEEIEMLDVKGKSYVNFLKVMNEGIKELRKMEEMKEEKKEKAKKLEREGDKEMREEGKVDVNEMIAKELIMTHIDFMEKVELDERPILIMINDERNKIYEKKTKNDIRYGETMDKEMNVFESMTIKRMYEKIQKEEKRQSFLKDELTKLIERTVRERGYEVKTNDMGDIMLVKS